MLSDMLHDGKITPETNIIEPSSGNTGVGLAMCAAVMGLRMTIVMPAELSLSKQKIIKAFGANLVLTPGSDINPA